MFDTLSAITTVMGSLLILSQFAELLWNVCKRLSKAIRKWWVNRKK